MVQCSLDRFEIVYNGASGASYGVFLPDYPEISQPEKRYETFSVPGRDGDLISDDNSIGNITVKHFCRNRQAFSKKNKRY